MDIKPTKSMILSAYLQKAEADKEQFLGVHMMLKKEEALNEMLDWLKVNTIFKDEEILVPTISDMIGKALEIYRRYKN